MGSIFKACYLCENSVDITKDNSIGEVFNVRGSGASVILCVPCKRAVDISECAADHPSVTCDVLHPESLESPGDINADCIHRDGTYNGYFCDGTNSKPCDCNCQGCEYYKRQRA